MNAARGSGWTMFDGGKPDERILVVRLGAMGDIIHAVPAVAALKQSLPASRITWVVESKWAPLLEGNPFIDRMVLLRRGTARGLLGSWRELLSQRYEFGIDFQGLAKSAMVAWVSRPERIFGFAETRERVSGIFYTETVAARSAHVVDRGVELAEAVINRAGARLKGGCSQDWLPHGHPEGELPNGDFVLASPLAGWASKQWPVEYYRELASRLHRELGIPLVVNLPARSAFPELDGVGRHVSGLPGLIDATRRAAAVVGVDSGPLHLAAALGKPGAALFGPTDPTRNGPYGGSLTVLRSTSAATTYKRHGTVDESMRQITPDVVFETLRAHLGARRVIV